MTKYVRGVYKHPRIYDKLLANPRYRRNVGGVLERALETIQDDIPEPAHILDLGCGTGLATEVIGRVFPSSFCYGFDNSEEMLRVYRKNFPCAILLIGDFNTGKAARFPEKDKVELTEMFDLVVSSGSLSEYGEYDNALQFVFRVLNPRGILVNIGNRKGTLGNLISEKLWRYNAQGSAKFIEACERAGFSTQMLQIPEGLGFTRYMKYCVVARKM